MATPARFLGAIALALFATAAAAGDFDPLYLSQYQGTYRFDDGLCITGGRMDENGSHLLYMDVWHNRLGGLFAPDGDVFQSLVRKDQSLRFDAGGDVLHWTHSDGTDRVARRIGRPDSRAVRFEGDGVALAGTLYTPHDAKGPLPGVVLAHGSGPVDRFGGTWITFFTNLGFAVLSYDKRGVGESGGDWRKADYVTLAGDLSAAVDWLAAQPGIDARRIGIHASSQSGWYAPYAARHDPRVAFLIQRAGPALPVGATTQHENVEEWRGKGLPESVIRPAADFWSALYALAAQGASHAKAEALLEKAQSEPWFAPAYGTTDWKTIHPDWWQRQLVNERLHPADDAAHLKIPILWFLAENDENVPYAASRKALEAVKRQSHPDLTVVSIKNARHSFLVREKDGSVRYTDRYWPVMAHWLEAKDMTKVAFENCSSRNRQDRTRLKSGSAAH